MNNDQQGSFSIREYDPMVLALTDMNTSDSRGNSSFMKLFKYIDGNNHNNSKIAMTTPVFMHPDNRMSFVLPKENRDTPPEPLSTDVTIESVEAFTAAVVSFNGRLNKSLVNTHTQELRAWIVQKGLEENGETILAQYDPPWTPGPMRKNEIIIPIVSTK
jgi:hypothetical protein